MEIFYKVDPEPEELARRIKDDVLRARRAGMVNAVTGIEARAVRNAPVKTSNLANARTTEVSQDGSRGVIRFTAPYVRYVHEGTGLYGPHRAKIVPKRKRALYWPGATHPWKNVRGMVGRPFLTDAAEQVDPAKLYQNGFDNYLKRGAK